MDAAGELTQLLDRDGTTFVTPKAIPFEPGPETGALEAALCDALG